MSTIRFTIKVNGVLTDPTSIALSDPTGAYGVKRNDNDDIVVVDGTAMTQVATGVYEHQFEDPELGLTYGYYVKYALNGSTYYSEGEIQGKAEGSIKTLTEMKADVLTILEDADNEVFTEEAVTRGITMALRTASRFAPAESRETRTFTAGSRQLDISDIEGFLMLVPEHPAEYPVGQYPAGYRNASVFNKTVTVQVSKSPAAGETVYLYCLKHHALTDAASTLPLELEPLIADYAAGQAALNWLGKGRTAIQAALNDIDGVTAVFDDLNNWLGNATQALAAMVDEVGNIESAAQAGESDLQSAREAITASVQAFGDKLSQIGNQVEQARADLASGRGLINTVSNGLNPENDYFQAAVGELSTLSNIVTQARMELSTMQAGTIYTGIAAREQSAVGLFTQAAGVYGRQVSGTLAGAGVKLQQAGAQLRIGTARLSVPNLMLSYTRWAQGKIAAAEKGMRALQKPRTFREWGED